MENGDNSIGKPEREVRSPGPSRVIALRINEFIITHSVQVGNKNIPDQLGQSVWDKI